MSEPIPLKCPNCGSVLRAEDLDFSPGIIRCSYCKALASMPSGPAARTGFQPRGEIPLPQGITLVDDGTNVVITRRWFSPIVFFLIPFCIAWDAFLLFWYGIAFSTNAPWIMKVFPLAHVAVGLGLTYFVAAILMNRTVIAAGQGLLRVGHGPLPWPGNAQLSADSVDQLFCREHGTRARHGTSVSYGLWAALREGASRKLLGSTLTQDQALFIEQKLERALAIKDRAVAGELPR